MIIGANYSAFVLVAIYMIWNLDINVEIGYL